MTEKKRLWELRTSLLQIPISLISSFQRSTEGSLISALGCYKCLNPEQFPLWLLRKGLHILFLAQADWAGLAAGFRLLSLMANFPYLCGFCFISFCFDLLLCHFFYGLPKFFSFILWKFLHSCYFLVFLLSFIDSPWGGNCSLPSNLGDQVWCLLWGGVLCSVLSLFN